MARKKKADSTPVEDYRHEAATRKNNPPARLAAEGSVPVLPKAEYSYSPRLPPALRFDTTGAADRLPTLLEEATRRPLTAEEARTLADALRNREPWLEWAGKRELPGFTVDPVAVHIHERVSTQAIIAAAARQDVERDLFADPEQDYREAVQFYQHEVDWSNRMILGDSLLVMSSLARREDLAGKVQMIYIDPPYGIKFASNFQPEIGKRDVKDKESDLTREPEMVKAFRDTWHLGVHSYLSYLRDRLVVARELLADTGSIFVQMGEENLHLVRSVLDEVFGPANRVVTIVIKKKSQTVATEPVNDFLLWYAKDRKQLAPRRLTEPKSPSDEDSRFNKIELPSGERRSADLVPKTDNLRAWDWINDDYPIVSQDPSPTRSGPFELHGRPVIPGDNRHWTYDPEAGMTRLRQAERLRPAEKTARGIVRWSDGDRAPISNLWADLHGEPQPIYVVQTNRKIVERCLLMTTDPGDLVLDPTCGSGTTAYVAEQWGRRWITIDTSRVAIAIARQRLLTAKFDYYRLRDDNAGVAGGFRYRTVPHVTLKSIAQNTNLDPIFAKHEPILDGKLAACNAALAIVTAAERRKLELKLLDKQRAEGKRAVTDADRRRWELPPKGQTWQHWTVPFDTDPDWPPPLADAVMDYRRAWRAKVDEVNACIAANAEQEELVDQPEAAKGVTRVSGPFTVEGVQPREVSLGKVMDTVGGFGGGPEEVGPTFGIREARLGESPENVEAYLDRMVRLLRSDGVRFPDNKQMRFSRLEAVYTSGQGGGFHAEGRWVPEGQTDPEPEGPATVGVVFGPQFGPVTEKMVEDRIRPASRRY